MKLNNQLFKIDEMNSLPRNVKFYCSLIICHKIHSFAECHETPNDKHENYAIQIFSHSKILRKCNNKKETHM